MCRNKLNVHRVLYCSLFQASTRDLGTYPLCMGLGWGDGSSQNRLRYPFRKRQDQNLNLDNLALQCKPLNLLNKGLWAKTLLCAF